MGTAAGHPPHGAVEAAHGPRPAVGRLVPRPTIRHLVITKVLLSAAFALSVAVGVAAETVLFDARVLTMQPRSTSFS